jgi:DNA polymerase-3 subunit delta
VPGTPPTVYLLYGDDLFTISETVQQLRDKLGDAGLNLQRFSAIRLDLEALSQACRSHPFLAARRLIVLSDAERLPRQPEWQERFLALLDQLPPTCALVLLEQQDLSSTKLEEGYRRSSPLYAWATAHPDSCYLRRFGRPRGPRFTQWLIERCRALGGQIHPSAAALLAEYVAEDQYLAEQELHKLLDFVDRAREIQAAEVEQLTPFAGQADVFAMVDAVGHKDGKRSLQLIHQLLQDHDPAYVFSMLTRQFRLLLQAREALDRRQDPQQALGVHPFVARKVTEQCRNFQLAELERAFRQLLAIDLSHKRGDTELDVALESYLAALTH